MILLSKLFLNHWDQHLYKDRIIYSKQSRNQNIVLTKRRSDIRLFLDGNLQLSSIDEHRYHESLIHVPLSLKKVPVRTVLLLGAGDGMAARELLKYPSIEQIILVDLDEDIINLAKENIYIQSLNRNSLSSSKVKIVISDAFTFLRENDKLFDLIIADLPAPNNNSLARLYSKHFYKLIRNNLSADGFFVAQATSPYFAMDAFWSIEKTVKASGFEYVYPYHAQIPSFGDWGFVMVSMKKRRIQSSNIPVETKFLDKNNLPILFVFEKDLRSNHIEVNELDSPILLNLYLKGWNQYR